MNLTTSNLMATALGKSNFLKSLLPKLVRTKEIVTVTGEAWERGSDSTENVRLPHSEAGGWLYYVCNCLCWLSQLIQGLNAPLKFTTATTKLDLLLSCFTTVQLTFIRVHF